MDGGAWQAAVHGITESRIQLSDFTFTFHFHALEREMATHSSILAWRIPGTGEPGGCRLWVHTESDTTEVTQQQQVKSVTVIILSQSKCIILNTDFQTAFSCIQEKYMFSIQEKYMMGIFHYLHSTFHIQLYSFHFWFVFF